MENDAISVEWVNLPPSTRELPRKTRLQPAQSFRQVKGGQPQELPLQTVAPVGTSLAVDLPRKEESPSLRETPAVILDRGYL